jgi:hypothetical protein
MVWEIKVIHRRRLTNRKMFVNVDIVFERVFDNLKKRNLGKIPKSQSL